MKRWRVQREAGTKDLSMDELKNENRGRVKGFLGEGAGIKQRRPWSNSLVRVRPNHAER